ncbi:hypothetical protein ACK8P5_02695 [Paenibacillus sp. EC2-1]|uniref:hypothetical protein n=1 Tax=Paenibacillus sp. EC2-1 TaxID=3388665 RepID=UPI003BEF289F
MSQPSIPNITPIISLTKKETLSLLLSSLAMSELAISHILNAEAEKIQSFVHFANHNHCVKTKDYIRFNHAVSHLIEDVNMEQYLSLSKLDRIISLIEDCGHHCEPDCDHSSCEDPECCDECEHE